MQASLQAMSGWWSTSTLNYLFGRGFDEHTLRRHCVVEWDVPPTGCPDKEWAERFGDRAPALRGKIVFPSFSPSGDLVGVECRTPYQKDPYKLNSFRSAWVPAWRGLPCYMEKIWRSRSVVLVEGVFDAAPLWRVFPEVPVLVCGTSRVTRQQYKFLCRFADLVVVVFDHDQAGHDGVQQLKQKRPPFEVIDFSRYGEKRDDPGRIWQRGGTSLIQDIFGILETYTKG